MRGVPALYLGLHAYIVVSLLTGARTEELRALTWSYVDLDSDPPFIMVWRSVRAGGDTKTRKSRRTRNCHSAASTCYATTRRSKRK
jgi:integrase